MKTSEVGNYTKKQSTGGMILGRKDEKRNQRKAYKEMFKNVKHGHGTRSIKKKDESALGR